VNISNCMIALGRACPEAPQCVERVKTTSPVFALI
jgi:hypothetical protein